ncbi:MAG: hypothetical protein IPI73_23550 [Betaproteobacteria bacterium]|nr:hypothetical protein [Betaproteobacteria bacterium]
MARFADAELGDLLHALPAEVVAGAAAGDMYTSTVRERSPTIRPTCGPCWPMPATVLARLAAAADGA